MSGDARVEWDTSGRCGKERRLADFLFVMGFSHGSPLQGSLVLRERMHASHPKECGFVLRSGGSLFVCDSERRMRTGRRRKGGV